MPKLNKIVIGDHAFETEEIIELSGTEFDLCVSTDLPSLETLELGWVVFSGKLNIGSLTMKSWIVGLGWVVFSGKLNIGSLTMKSWIAGWI